MSVRRLCVLLMLGAAGAAWPQDDVEARKTRKARLAELRKQLNSADEAGKIRAIEELASVADEEAVSLLSGKLVGGSQAARVAAAGAIAKHRKPAAVRALDNALGANAGDEAVVKACLAALGELDQCRCIPVLAAALPLRKYAYVNEALDAIAKIGCPEAGDALVAFLRVAEKEEKKPDTFEDEELGTIENRNKNKALAERAPRVRETLSQVTGQTFQDARGWSAWLGSEKTLKLTSVFLCDIGQQTFEVPSGKPKKCPYAEGKSNHNDILLKHRRE